MGQKPLRVLVLADAFPPMRTSAAVLIRDLSLEISKLNYDVSVVIPTAGLNEKIIYESYHGVSVIRIKVPRAKGVGNARRLFAELLMPIFLFVNSKDSGLFRNKWNGVIWYSPTIFFGLCIRRILLENGAKKYLIVRDIFPDWSLDLGIMKSGVVYHVLKFIANRQYLAADFIGIQSSGNMKYFENNRSLQNSRIEVLFNWLSPQKLQPCPIDLGQTKLEGRKIFIYAGNMGVAQKVDVILDLASLCSNRNDLGFIFVGRGSEAERLAKKAQILQLENVLFFDEVHPDEIASLYKKCVAGLVLLDERHRSHNIPGKFLSYLEAGLPVLANINSGNDLEDLIRDESVGVVSKSSNKYDLRDALDELLEMLETDAGIHTRCMSVFKNLFSVNVAARQILSRLFKDSSKKQKANR